MKIPCKYSQITLEKYQEVFPIVQRIITEEDEDKKYSIQLELLESFGVNHKELNIGQIAKLIKRLSFLKANTFKLVYKHLWIKGKLYRAENDPEKLNTGQYISIKTLVNDGGLIEQLHNIAPVCYKELTLKGFKYTGNNHVELAEWFKKQPCNKVLPLVFFCSKVYEHSIVNTMTYSTAMEIIRKRELELQEILSDGTFSIDGIGTQQ